MHRSTLPDLTFPRMQYGTHQVPWDLRIFLYKGGGRLTRSRAAKRINSGTMGELRESRLPFVIKLHDVLAAKLESGISPLHFQGILQATRSFLAWADKNDRDLTLDKITDHFIQWAEVLFIRSRSTTTISPNNAYEKASLIADLIGRVLDSPRMRPGVALMKMTCLHRLPDKRHVLGTNADKENLSRTFQFGEFLDDVCNALDLSAIRGPLPFIYKLRNGQSLVLAAGLKSPSLRLDNPGRTKSSLKRALARRAGLREGASIIGNNKRSRLLNIRIEAELLIFVAQTGMNLTNAARIQRENFRWQTDGEDLLVFRVFKGRRSGDAIFRCFKAYRRHLDRYLSWLEETGLYATDDRLFPFVYHQMIPPQHAAPCFSGTKQICRELGIEYFLPRQLRKTRVNWLLRRSRDPDLTADQAAHSKETLLRVYEQPHHQVASAEIIRFHLATDPTISPPGPGMCTDSTRAAVVITDIPAEAPIPDCVSPEGCLFCVYHRDVLSADYCWKLSSHSRIKQLELSLYKPPENAAIHPCNRVIDRIQSKLSALANLNDECARWVRDGDDAVRAGRYHPVWDGYITLFEMLE